MPKSSQAGNAKQLQISLKHSPIGRPSRQRIFLHALGLRKLHQTVQRPSTPQVLGLLDKVKHLVEVSAV
ncbi:MAG: 50S ribosomal protein L30 [Nitrospirota bacterium]|nr:50S ribosomal protein L30 [Nitrospirota bacterium]